MKSKVELSFILSGLTGNQKRKLLCGVICYFYFACTKYECTGRAMTTESALGVSKLLYFNGLTVSKPFNFELFGMMIDIGLKFIQHHPHALT